MNDRRRNATFAAVALCAASGLSGCIGVSLVGEKDSTKAAGSFFVDSKGLQTSSSCIPGPANLPPVSEGDVRTALGDPGQERTDEQGKHILSYSNGIAFRGIVLWAVIPIPLIVPTGHQQTDYVFDGDVLIRRTMHNSDVTSFSGCGFLINCVWNDPADFSDIGCL